MKYRRKPVVVEAVQWTGDNEQEIANFDPFFGGLPDYPKQTQLVIQTMEGVMKVNKGDWIIRGVKGELYPCKPDIFEATYEPSESPRPEAGQG